ncbi:substrate-binding domain-containing protein [Neiella sp. HB171785]|uniref:Substrate-binding domain-containing protein n=1 Tax=Neiella litorisoli TaxID=2771431 RepID=A0A8J6UH77_9GAMM|nr:substrate-binding domain-containing protein [Neiella litorisoli]MBD1391306.1 substrate-binding domain-containing protein [Neiella litorisoli]
MPSSTISAFIAVLALLSSEQQTPDCIGLVTASGGDQFWREVEAGASAAAAEVELKLEVRSSFDDKDIAQQRVVIDELQTMACSTIVMAPNSPERAQDVAKLKQQGIRTIFIDRDFPAERATAILTDNYATGERAAIAMAAELPPGSAVGLLRLHKQVSSTSEREQGFIDGAQVAGLTVVLDDYIDTPQSDADSGATTAQQAAQLIASVPQLAGLFTPNESTTTAAVLARQSLAQPSTIVHIGVDSNKLLLKSLAQQELHSLFLQRPFLIGYQGVMAASKLQQGHALPDVILTEATYITTVDLQQPEIQALLRESDSRASSNNEPVEKPLTD